MLRLGVLALVRAQTNHGSIWITFPSSASAPRLSPAHSAFREVRRRPNHRHAAASIDVPTTCISRDPREKPGSDRFCRSGRLQGGGRV